MNAIEMRAYEVCGYWTIVLIRVFENEAHEITRECLYKGDHNPIDDDDPVIHTLLLLAQIQGDLSYGMRGGDLAAMERAMG